MWKLTVDLGSGKKKSCSSAVVIFSWLGMLMLNCSLYFDFVPFVTERGISVGQKQSGERG